MGKGPEAAMDRILKKLKTRDKEELLADWYRSPTGNNFFLELEGDCHRLLNYALPKETIVTQITTFVALTTLMTQYPPIRSVCLRYKEFNGLENSEEAALNLWKRNLNQVPSDLNWEGFYQIAAACLSDNILCILEATPIGEWGKVSPTQLGVIDRLLAKISTEKLEALDYVTIRYLGGILQLETFWKREHYEDHQDTTVLLLRKLLKCVKETGIEYRGEELFCDREGIDLLVNATIQGIQIWLEPMSSIEITIPRWFGNLQELVALLSRPEGKFYLPLSWQTATTTFQEYQKDRYKCKIEVNEAEIKVQDIGRGGWRKGIKSTTRSSKWEDGRRKEPDLAVLETEYRIHDEVIDQRNNSFERVRPRRWRGGGALRRIREESNPLTRGVFRIVKSLLKGKTPREGYLERAGRNPYNRY
ncbi:hypothetical protein CPB86DRAFT_786456 [Serendipita vermifera]|nr:hypothetical protein CPB86DRAFT_786456 [Serendipita vermifera]